MDAMYESGFEASKPEDDGERWRQDGWQEENAWLRREAEMEHGAAEEAGAEHIGAPAEIMSTDADQYRWMLVNGEEWAHLLHPAIVVMVLTDEDGEHEEPIVVFKEEDYYEPDEDGFRYAGLVVLQQCEEAPGEYVLPETFRCVRCGYGKAVWDGAFETDYRCERCDADYLVHTREHLLNAAVLLLCDI